MNDLGQVLRIIYLRINVVTIDFDEELKSGRDVKIP